MLFAHGIANGQVHCPFESCQVLRSETVCSKTTNAPAHSARHTTRQRKPDPRCLRISDRNRAHLVVSQPIHGQPSESCHPSVTVAAGSRGAHHVGRGRACAGGPARASIIRVAGVHLPKVWHRLPCCSRHSAGGESARQMRDLPLQLGRHAGLGLLPNQHGPSETTRLELTRSPGLQGKHRLRLPALPRTRRLHAVEYIQQRLVQKIHRAGIKAFISDSRVL